MYFHFLIFFSTVPAAVPYIVFILRSFCADSFDVYINTHSQGLIVICASYFVPSFVFYQFSIAYVNNDLIIMICISIFFYFAMFSQRDLQFMRVLFLSIFNRCFFLDWEYIAVSSANWTIYVLSSFCKNKKSGSYSYRDWRLGCYSFGNAISRSVINTFSWIIWNWKNNTYI